MYNDGAVNNVEELRKFRVKLVDLSEKLRDQRAKTDAIVEEVAKSWADDQFKKFKEGFEEDKNMLDPLRIKISETELKILKPLEDLLREYLAS